MKYVLIYVLLSSEYMGYSGNTHSNLATSHVEFDAKKACDDAAAAMLKEANAAFAKCFPKL